MLRDQVEYYNGIDKCAAKEKTLLLERNIVPELLFAGMVMTHDKIDASMHVYNKGIEGFITKHVQDIVSNIMQALEQYEIIAKIIG